jgi:hypothetical protein
MAGSIPFVVISFLCGVLLLGLGTAINKSRNLPTMVLIVTFAYQCFLDGIRAAVWQNSVEIKLVRFCDIGASPLSPPRMRAMSDRLSLCLSSSGFAECLCDGSFDFMLLSGAPSSSHCLPETIHRAERAP